MYKLIAQIFEYKFRVHNKMEVIVWRHVKHEIVCHTTRGLMRQNPSARPFWLYNHDDINNTNNIGGLCRFLYERLYLFLSSALGDTRREIQIIEAYANPTMLTPPPRAVHLVVSQISTHLCRSKPKLIWSDQIRKTQLPASTVVPQLCLFQNPKILRPSLPCVTSSTHSIHSNYESDPISCQGVYYDRWLSYPSRAGVRVLRLTTTPEPRDTE